MRARVVVALLDRTPTERRGAAAGAQGRVLVTSAIAALVHKSMCVGALLCLYVMYVWFVCSVWIRVPPRPECIATEADPSAFHSVVFDFGVWSGVARVLGCVRRLIESTTRIYPGANMHRIVFDISSFLFLSSQSINRWWSRGEINQENATQRVVVVGTGVVCVTCVAGQGGECHPTPLASV